MSRSHHCAVLILLAFGCGPGAPAPGASVSEAPPPPPEAWAGAVGEYALGSDTVSLREESGGLQLLPWSPGRREEAGWTEEPSPLQPLDDSTLTVVGTPGTVRLRRDPGGGLRGLAIGGLELSRISLGGEGGGGFRIIPVRPPEELRAEALSAAPPREEGEFLPSDLVELIALDSTLLLDVRYAGTNNFMGEVFYSSPRAFLQRPAAEALAQAHAWLKERGYGLLIHDGYRPWYVTKMFWDATPENLKIFVADPASGSRHNRGCAVDLTLVDLATGGPVTMPGGYDEMSPRSYVTYPGGTSRQRWLRDLLRKAMEAHGFTVYPAEWWHFDYRDWRRYRIGNETFEEIGAG